MLRPRIILRPKTSTNTRIKYNANFKDRRRCQKIKIEIYKIFVVFIEVIVFKNTGDLLIEEIYLFFIRWMGL